MPRRGTKTRGIPRRRGRIGAAAGGEIHRVVNIKNEWWSASQRTVRIKLYRGQDLLFLLLVLGRRDELLNLVELPEALLGGL